MPQQDRNQVARMVAREASNDRITKAIMGWLLSDFVFIVDVDHKCVGVRKLNQADPWQNTTYWLNTDWREGEN